MPNLVVCHISVALKINFKTERVFRDSKVCKRCKLQRDWIELKSKLCFPEPSVTKHLTIIYGSEENRNLFKFF